MAMLQVQCTKGKKNFEFDSDALPAEVFREALIQGLKVLLNRTMSKITKESFNGDEEKMKAAANAQAQKNHDDIMAGKIRFTGEKRKKEVTGEVMTAARQIARGLVKQGLKDAGVKVSHVDAKEITKAANMLIDETPAIIEQAKALVASRKEAATVGIDLSKFAKSVPINEKKKAAEEREAAERKAASSAKKAGKVAVRAKPKAGQVQHATH